MLISCSSEDIKDIKTSGRENILSVILCKKKLSAKGSQSWLWPEAAVWWLRFFMFAKL